jgi:hypothetical protein
MFFRSVLFLASIESLASKLVKGWGTG